MNKTTMILDSSVVAKWFFVESDSKNALIIKEKFIANVLSIAIPFLLYYEINNILKTAAKTFRINENEVTKVYEAFLQFNFISYSPEFLFKKTLEAAIRYDISSYDASYVALSEYLQVKFVTADKKLLRQVSNEFVIDVEEYTR